MPVGAPCNVCESRDELFGTITRMNKDGSGLRYLPAAVRNSVGFDWHPKTRELWFTDNGRDMLGDDLPPDELNHAPRAGLHFGFPYLHGNDVVDPEYGKKTEKYTFYKTGPGTRPACGLIGYAVLHRQDVS